MDLYKEYFSTKQQKSLLDIYLFLFCAGDKNKVQTTDW